MEVMVFVGHPCEGFTHIAWDTYRRCGWGAETDPMARCSPCTDGSFGSVIVWTVAVEPRITQGGRADEVMGKAKTGWLSGVPGLPFR